jgi:predicted  nucleic acid-binding Zn-ribbon protein
VRFDDTRTEWRIEAIERSIQGKADAHEIHSLRSHVDNLEYSLRESRSETSELRSQLYSLQEAVEQLQRDLLERLES